MKNMIYISKAEYEKLTDSRIVLEYENQKLKRELAWLKKFAFGKKSEKIRHEDQTPDLPGLELESAPEESEESTVEINGYTRKKKRRSTKEDTLQVPESIPRKYEIIDIPESEKVNPRTGGHLVCIGEEIIEQLAFKPAEYYLNVKRILKYADPEDPSFGVRQAKTPDKIINGSKFDTSFMANVVFQKYGLHMPLNRIIEHAKLAEIKLPEKTMSSLVMQLGEKLTPLVKEMEKESFARGILFTDDTPVKLIQPGRGKTKEARMWIYLSSDANSPPYYVYKFSPGRNHSFPEEHLKNFRGIIHADAFQAYEKLDENLNSGIQWAPCWAHARRKFFDLPGSLAIRKKVLKMMQRLFRYERIAWKAEPELRLKIRQRREKVIADRLFEYLTEQQKSFLPSSNTAQAINYILSRKEKFRRYLDNPDIRMDNNKSENALRKVALGRKNWLFVGSEKSGHAAANLMSLVQTCRAMNINPFEYLNDIFNKLMSYPAKRIGELLPDRWAKSQRANLEN